MDDDTPESLQKGYGASRMDIASTGYQVFAQGRLRVEGRRVAISWRNNEERKSNDEGIGCRQRGGEHALVWKLSEP